MNINLNDLIPLIELESNPFKSEILDQLQGLIQVKESFLLESSHAYHTYETRFEIQKSITKHQSVIGWDGLLSNLKTEATKPDSQTRLTDLIGEKYGYLIFSNKENNQLIGVLKFTEQKVNKGQELTEDGSLKGSWSNSRFYLNQLEIK